MMMRPGRAPADKSLMRLGARAGTAPALSQRANRLPERPPSSRSHRR